VKHWWRNKGRRGRDRGGKGRDLESTPREVPFNFSAVVAPMAKWEPRSPNGMHHYTQLNILLKVAAAMQPLVTVTIATITVATVLAVDKG